MRRFIPEVNPSYRDKMHLISAWYVEFNERGLPNREVGVGAVEILPIPPDACD